MDNNNDNYTDNTFNLYQAYNYTLLLQVEATSFNYAVVHENRLLLSAQNCELNELTQPRQLNDILTATYKKVIIGMPATGLTLVPKSLFNEEYVGEFARFLDVKDTEKVFAQTLDDENVIIYKSDSALVDMVQKFNLQNVVYTGCGWVNTIAKSNPDNNNLYVEIGKDAVQFLYFSLGHLRFYNTFEYKNEDELVYFTTFVTEELRLKPQQLTLVVSGDISTGDKSMKWLTDFFPKVELNNLKVLALPGQISEHKILALAALSLCGSSEAL